MSIVCASKVGSYCCCCTDVLVLVYFKFPVVYYKDYEKEVLSFQPITSTAIEAHEVYRIPLYNSEEDTWSHNAQSMIGVLKHICIQDNKAFKINTSRKPSNKNKPGKTIFPLVLYSCRRGDVHFPAHKTTVLTITLRPQHCNQIQHELQQHKGKETNAERCSHNHCHRSNKTCETLQNHK